MAEHGGNGEGGKRHGENGADTVILVPRGTIIRDAESSRILHDMSDGAPYVACRGGRGGWGNKHFATATRQVPRFAKDGLAGEEKTLLLELKMIADVGLVGLPSAGKKLGCWQQFPLPGRRLPSIISLHWSPVLGW